MKFVHRRMDGSIAVTMDEILPGYSLTPTAQELLVEVVADDDPGLLAQRFPPDPRDGTHSLIERRARALEDTDPVAAIKLRLQLL